MIDTAATAPLKIADHPKAKQQRLDKRRKFCNIGEERVNRLLKDIALIGNLGNRSTYDYTEGDKEKMFTRIETALEVCKSRFEMHYRDQNEFSF